MKLTNLIGKQVYSIYEGEIIGTISGVTFNNLLNKINSFKLFDKDDNDFEIMINNVKAFSDCVVVTNKNKLDFSYQSKDTSPIFKDVIDTKAKMCGKIIDAEIEESGDIINYITDLNFTAKPENIYLRKGFVYYSPTPIKICNYKPKNKKPTSLKDINVTILQKSSQNNFLPSRATFNTTSILGKVAKNDLYGINNEIIIKCNQIITEKIVTEATKHNRLNQLYYIAV